MSMRDPFVIVLLLTFGAAGEGRAQITDPIPERIEKRGLMVEIRDVARLPMTRGIRPPDQDVNPAGWARVSFVREFPTVAVSPTTHAASCTCSRAATGLPYTWTS